jgi:hypothetical protein
LVIPVSNAQIGGKEHHTVTPTQIMTLTNFPHDDLRRRRLGRRFFGCWTAGAAAAFFFAATTSMSIKGIASGGRIGGGALGGGCGAGMGKVAAHRLHFAT